VGTLELFSHDSGTVNELDGHYKSCKDVRAKLNIYLLPDMRQLKHMLLLIYIWQREHMTIGRTVQAGEEMNVFI